MTDSRQTPAQNKLVFPHQQYLEKRDGVDYLPLKWRLSWLRTEYPHAKISTSLVSNEGGLIVFKAEISLPEGGLATGWGAKARSENNSEAGSLDYIIEAENQALGRALAALGYGTEYAQDFDPPAEHQAIPLFDQTDDDDEGIEVPPYDGTTNDNDESENDGSEEAVKPTPIRKAVEAMPEKRSAPKLAEASAMPTYNAATTNGVDERLKDVRDDVLRLKIKQIYHEARQRFNYDEEKVDGRSLERYGKSTYELDFEEAEEYLERIITAPKKRN